MCDPALTFIIDGRGMRGGKTGGEGHNKSTGVNIYVRQDNERKLSEHILLNEGVIVESGMLVPK